MDSVVKFAAVASTHAAYTRLGSAQRTIKWWHTTDDQLISIKNNEFSRHFWNSV
jgi:hypothetical protein